MPKVEVQTDLVLVFKELTEEIDQVIGEEVHNLFNAIKQKGEDVHDTRFFKNSIKAPRRVGKMDWRIELKAKYSSILWSGRRKVGNRYYGSVNWYAGGLPMLKKMENKIVRRTDNVSK